MNFVVSILLVFRSPITSIATVVTLTGIMWFQRHWSLECVCVNECSMCSLRASLCNLWLSICVWVWVWVMLRHLVNILFSPRACNSFEPCFSSINTDSAVRHIRQLPHIFDHQNGIGYGAKFQNKKLRKKFDKFTTISLDICQLLRIWLNMHMTKSFLIKFQVVQAVWDLPPVGVIL